MKFFSAPSFRFLAIVPVLFLFCSFTSLLIPTVAHAQGGGSDSVQTSGSATKIDPVSLQNPLKNITTIEGLLVAILNIIMILMVPVIVFFIIYAGFKYVMAQGNASQVEEATRALTYAIIGGVLILGAVAISQIIKSVVDAF